MTVPKLRFISLAILFLTFSNLVCCIYFDMARVKERCYVEDFYGKSVII